MSELLHTDASQCCAPQRSTSGTTQTVATVMPGKGIHHIEQATIKGGTFLMGDSHGDSRPGDGETPQHEVTVSAFSIDTTAVTNADFASFVTATGYRTEAEVFGYSAVFFLLVDARSPDILGQPPQTPWWLGVAGADWCHPEGRNSGIEERADHPVVHVSWNDAKAYCKWAHRRLPTEAEWEFAARAGREAQRYPWGNELRPDGEWRCNIWQGSFPNSNSMDDGWLATAPVRSFRPNGFGLWQMIGNVWEWCEDWHDPSYYATSPWRDPAGPDAGRLRVLRGGSYLCHESYCNRYRNAARSSNTPDLSAGNLGFRTVGLS